MRVHDGQPGLLGFLETDYLQPYCFMRRVGKLFVMTAGGSSLNPLEALSQDKMHRLVEYLRASFDIVVFDLPPLVPISDAQVLTSMADGMLLVVRSGKTTFGALETGLRVVDKSKLLGVILNDLPPMMFHTHHHYSYYGSKYGGRYPYAPQRPKHRRKTYLDEN